MGEPTTTTTRRIHVLWEINTIAWLVLVLPVACFCGCSEDAAPKADAPASARTAAPSEESRAAPNEKGVIVTPPPSPPSQPPAK